MELESVSPQLAKTMAALGAAAVDHSTSMVASTRSPVVPGSEQLLGPEGGGGWIVVSEPAV